jgi:hypothetical protein
VSIRIALASTVLLTSTWSLLAEALNGDDPAGLAKDYAAAVEKLNAEHARKPGTETEADLAKKLPPGAASKLDELLASDSPDAPAALVRCAEAALDLDRVDDFERVRARLGTTSPTEAGKLGFVLSRPRFLMRGLDGVQPEGMKAIADVLDLVLDAYDEEFAFAEWSKVPGKKLRFRIHLVEKITAPPHFAPQFPWHSEVDFPVVDPKGFSSPTKEGQFLFYGLCHELGHVIAMWGDPQHEQDHHAWAHFTGITIVERLSKKTEVPALADLRDARWRSLEIERKKLEKDKVAPGRATSEEVLALFVALSDLVGTQAIGQAINALDKKDDRLRVNRVRYYDLDAFGRALLSTPEGKKKARELRSFFK